MSASPALYRVRRSRETRTETWSMCGRHLEARKAMGWDVLGSYEEPSNPDPSCWDCNEREWDGASVIETRIAEEEAAAKANEPKPVPVLPGQRRLF